MMLVYELSVYVHKHYAVSRMVFLATLQWPPALIALWDCVVGLRCGIALGVRWECVQVVFKWNGDVL
jgi:hypothetical protein